MQQRGVRAVVATAQRLVVFRNGAGNILLGIQRIAVYFVITAGEASRRALCQSLDGIVRLALVDQNTREPKARDLLEFRILGVGHDLRQRGDGFGGLVAFDVDARNRQLCLVGIGRIGIVLDDPVRNLLGFLAIVHLQCRGHLRELFRSLQRQGILMRAIVLNAEPTAHAEHDPAQYPGGIFTKSTLHGLQLFVVGQIFFSHGYSHSRL